MLETLVLDLDETLIHSVTMNQARNMNLKPYKHYRFAQFIILERPYLAQFLRSASENFNLVVWTAASEGYARFIVHNILQKYTKRPIQAILFDRHCDISERSTGILKHLDILKKIPKFSKPKSMILIDDNPDVAKQNNQVITIHKYTGNLSDNELLNIQKVLSIIHNS